MESEQQQFVLRWHYHETTILNSLPKLLESELLTDITLSVGCRNIKAHRVVLATCSSYFLQLFQDMGPLQHPVIILQDTDYNDLNAIISFIYRGQCLVSEKQLPSVLAAAKLLQIRGLCDLKVPESKPQVVNMTKDLKVMNININNDSTNKQCVIKDDSNNIQIKQQQSIPEINKTCDTNTINKIKPDIGAMIEENISQNNLQMINNNSTSFFNDKSHPVSLPAGNPNRNNLEPETNGDDLITQWKTKSGNNSKCFICGKYLSNQYNLRVHMETHEDGYHACSSCPHVSRSRDALRKHISYRHPDENISRKRKSKMDT